MTEVEFNWYKSMRYIQKGFSIRRLASRTFGFACCVFMVVALSSCTTTYFMDQVALEKADLIPREQALFEVKSVFGNAVQDEKIRLVDKSGSIVGSGSLSEIYDFTDTTAYFENGINAPYSIFVASDIYGSSIEFQEYATAEKIFLALVALGSKPCCSILGAS